MEPTFRQVVVDIPCDVQQVDESGYPWAFLDEARDPSKIVPGAIVVSGDPDEPLMARVVDVSPIGAGVRVRLQILPGDSTWPLQTSMDFRGDDPGLR